MSHDIENIILGVIERWWASHYSERHGLVTSYDPSKHLAKVTYQPAGQESGWLPIETGHIGNGFGIAVGLTPGDGKSTGDQVIVRFQEGDFESGKIVQRVHSDADKSPRVESGEMVLWHQSGSKIFFAKDGSLTLQDGSGASFKFDGKGNIVEVCKNETATISQNQNVTVANDINMISTGGTVELMSKNKKVKIDAPAAVIDLQGGGAPIPPTSVTP